LQENIIKVILSGKEDTTMTLGERILILRRRQDMTQQQLAKEAGLNKNTIARLEQGNLKDLGGKLVAKLAQALGTSTDYLLGLTEESGVESERMPAALATVGT
jgi:transcriptional regulator with XRE-family HTH domain